MLAPFSEEAHAYAAKRLQRSGVELRLGVSAKEIAADRVKLSDGDDDQDPPVVWGGGLMAAPIAGRLRLPQGRGGRIDVAA